MRALKVSENSSEVIDMINYKEIVNYVGSEEFALRDSRFDSSHGSQLYFLDDDLACSWPNTLFNNAYGTACWDDVYILRLKDLPEGKEYWELDDMQVDLTDDDIKLLTETFMTLNM